jgi:hypothetical protein
MAASGGLGSGSNASSSAHTLGTPTHNRMAHSKQKRALKQKQRPSNLKFQTAGQSLIDRAKIKKDLENGSWLNKEAD